VRGPGLLRSSPRQASRFDGFGFAEVPAEASCSGPDRVQDLGENLQHREVAASTVARSAPSRIVNQLRVTDRDTGTVSLQLLFGARPRHDRTLLQLQRGLGALFVRQGSPVTGTVAGMAPHHLELLYLLVLLIVQTLIPYFVIRLAVGHGVVDANRRLGPGRDSSV